jgi:Cu-Zn family superoxide dismutase
MYAISIFRGKIHGYVIFSQKPRQQTLVTVNLAGFQPDTLHGFHIHEYGNTIKGCDSMGVHYNPYNKTHGNVYLDGKNRHVGDLINNLYPNNEGKVQIEFYDDLVQVHNILGRGLVIHETFDDLGPNGPYLTSGNAESLKTGNAKKRIACAVIALAKE